jgi:acetyl-CoA carboxylase carboxyltransferase component
MLTRTGARPLSDSAREEDRGCRYPGRAQVEETQDPAAKKQKLIENFRKIIDVYIGAGHDMIDDVIDPRETRHTICGGLEMAVGKRVERPHKKRGVVPV